jgi:transglutaminase-like putative cysteine protease
MKINTYKLLVILSVILILHPIIITAITANTDQNHVTESSFIEIIPYFSLRETYQVTIQYNDTITMKSFTGRPVEISTRFSIPQDQPNQIINQPIEFYPASGYGRLYFDNWGNKVAEYVRLLGSNEVDTAYYKLDAILSKIVFNVNPIIVSDNIPADIQSQYLSDEDYYDINHSMVQNSVNTAIGTETNPYLKAKKIHDYIILHLSYNISGGWDPAPIVLRRGDGSCSEFTYVFIAMCRAAGIPARYVGGTILGGSSGPNPIPHYDKYFHRWAQFYVSPYGWIPVDVTWDNSIDGDNVVAYDYFGVTDNYLLITTVAGAYSNVFGWTYNCKDSPLEMVQSVNRTGIWTSYERVSPNIPSSPVGQTNGFLFMNYDYEVSTTDPNGHEIYYWFDWDDGTNSGWIGPYSSGASCTASHAYSSAHVYQIKVKAKNSNDYESDWSPPLNVAMPKMKGILTLFNEFILNHQYFISLFRMFLHL